MGHPFYGVNSKPFLDLTPFISTEGLDKVAEEMAQFYVRRGPFNVVMFSEHQDLLPEQLSPEVLGFDCRAHPRQRMYPNGSAYQQQAYNSFFSPVLPLEQFMHLRIGGPHRFDVSQWDDTPWAKDVPLTMEWIRKLPCDVTRCTVYFSQPGQMMGVHRDAPTYPGFNTPLIYINPLLKPFFVMDGEGNKHIVDTPIAHFNNCDFHGMDQSNYRSCFSIRIGGWWHEWLIDETNTREHFANQPGNR